MARTICFLLLTAFAAASSASVVLPGDGPYYRLKRESTQYIYDQDGREIANQLEAYHEVFRRMYDQSFGWKLDERQDLILTSHRQQVTNAYATIIPNIKSVWYPSGGGFLEDSASSSWALTLDAHETAHLYQLNAKGEFPATLSKIFGNTASVFFFVLPIWVHPNIFTPSFLVEGNAVLNESRVNMGGRLHSGEMRALVLAQIKAGEIDPTRLINDQFRYPYGQVQYLQGGYFQAHLAAKYGIEKTNQFFKAQGNRWLWPFVLNKTFRDHFGASYPQEIREYTRGLEGLAKKQKATIDIPLLTYTFIGTLNHDADRIWFLATEGKAPPQLVVFDKQTKQISSSSRRNLQVGKVFFAGSTPLSVASLQHDLHNIEYSLYGENEKFYPAWRGQIVNDIRGGRTAALDAKNSWLETKLILDGQPYDVAHSSAILDDAGHVYYFRQNGAERILFKNREPVFKMDGFYGKPTEVAPDGTIYFIGNTDYGSTLYAYKNKEIHRVLESDRVVDARRVSDNEFLISEVSHKGHDIYLVPSVLKPAAPAIYSYGYPIENVIPNPAQSVDQLKADDQEYNALSALRHSSIEFSSSYSNVRGLGIGLATGFVDPLEYHSLLLAYSGTQFRNESVGVSYSLTKYLVDWITEYRYKEEWWERRDGTDQKAYNQDVATGFRIPLLRWRQWDAQVGLSATYDLEDRHNEATRPGSDIEETYGARSYFDLQYKNAPAYGMYSWREFNLSYINRLTSLPNEWRTKYNTSIMNLKYQHGFAKEFYLSLYGSAAWAENRDIDIEYDESPITNRLSIPLLTSHKKYVVKTAQASRLEFHKVFSTPAYSARIPIGVERMAPFVAAQGVFIDDSRSDSYPHNIFEWGYGADIQMLLFHRMPAIFRYMNAYNTTEPRKTESSFKLTLQKDF